MTTAFLFLIIVGVFVAIAASYLGSFMVLKRMSLVGDALSHVALPGMAIAISLNISPILGALVFLLMAAVIIWYIGETSEVYPEALVGILFTASLALGILLTKEPDLLEALFGNIEAISFVEGMAAIVLSLVAVIITYLISKGLTIAVISEEMAKSAGFKIKWINLIYLLLVSLIVALGVKFVGTLLTGALVIVPPASAKNISAGQKGYVILSALFALISSVTGIAIAKLLVIETGPAVVLVSVFIFLLTYLYSRFRRP